MKKFIYHILAGIVGFWLAVKFVSGVKIVIFPDSSFFGFPLTASWQVLIVLGVIFGLIDFFVKPILKTIALPLRVITFGLFSLVISMALILIIDLLFPELMIIGLIPLFWTTVIIWGVNTILYHFTPRQKKEDK